ncbi:hypothetical protein [Streptomyces subrutilus]|uniref:Uncharacterized protein n=1 Tax=Streptomyces subrutilus TaxID=36818 RepID=A0A1E5P0C1_9ACTN|nr:hypothetical protein [Streptomyces subrutilus]OEJ22503.1 hypothetical protein BGK67_33805 [Streptomyces subrutilus]
MGAVVLCAVFWAGAAGAVMRCVKEWRSGADQMWSSKWKVLAGALIVTAFPVMATARLAPSDARFFLEDFVRLLVLGSAGSVVAGWVASRRSDAQARALRRGLGLAIERRLWSPWVLVGLWSAAGVPFTVVEVVITIRYIEAHSPGPAADGTWAEADTIAWLSVLTIAVFVVVGVLHGLVQHRRRARGQRRVRNADQQYLITNPAD